MLFGISCAGRERRQFSLQEFGQADFGDMDEAERLRRYRRYVYETGPEGRKDGKRNQHTADDVVQKERDRNYALPLSEKLMKRTLYFSDSGIIGSKAFVSEHYRKFKHLFQSKHEKKPQLIKGLNNMYSLKRLLTLIKINAYIILLTYEGGFMDKIFSTRIDEAVYKRIGLLAQKLNVSKKAIIERAVMKYSDDVDMSSEVDPLMQTLGSWKRDEGPEETIKNAKDAFHQSMNRYQP